MFFRKWLRQESSSFVDAATVYEKAEEGLEAPDTRIMIQPVIPDNPEENTCPRNCAASGVTVGPANAPTAPDLQVVIKAWTDLSKDTKGAIMAMDRHC